MIKCFSVSSVNTEMRKCDAITLLSFDVLFIFITTIIILLSFFRFFFCAAYVDAVVHVL